MDKESELDLGGVQIANPFVHSFKISSAKRIQLWIYAVLLAPIRIVGLIIFFLLTSMVGELATRKMDFSKPMSGFRKHVLLPIFIFFGRLLFLCGGFNWISIKGKQASTIEAPILVLAPHSSFFDSLVVVALGMPSVVGKTETALSPIGSFIKMTQPILVNRDDPMSRQNTLQEIRTRSRSNGYWQQILIFPEGTCTNRSCLINYKQGAFTCGVPVQPALVRWHQSVDSVTWTWDGPGVWELVWMTVIQPHTSLEIEFLPVYQPSEDEKADPQLYADNVRNLMAKALNLPTTDLGFDDCRRIRTAVAYSLPIACYIHDYGKLTRALFSDNNLESSKSTGETRTSWVTAHLWAIASATRQWHLLGCSSLTPSLLKSIFFPGSASSEKEMVLLRRIVNTLPKTANGQPDIRVLAIQLCMLMFTDPPVAAMRYAFQVFDSDSFRVGANSYRGEAQLSDWSISQDDAIKLLHAAYRMPKKEAKFLLKNHASVLASSSSSYLRSTKEVEEELSSGVELPDFVFPDALYNLLTTEHPKLVSCYANYKAEMARIRRRAERPFSDTASSSNSTSSIYNINQNLQQKGSEEGQKETTDFQPSHSRNISDISVNSTNSLDFEMEYKEQDVRLRSA